MNSIDKRLAGVQFDAHVRDISMDGYGVLDHPDGLVFFVLGVFPGDEGKFEIISLKNKYGFAKLIQLYKTSSLRHKSPCQHQGITEKLCGGCPWMSIPYEQQIIFKKKILKHQFVRNQWITENENIDVIASPLIFEFRNRAQLKTDGNQLGFVSRFSRTISPIQNCNVLNKNLQNKVKYLQSKLPNEEWLPNKNYSWCYIEIDDDQNPHEFSLNKRRPFKQANTLQNENMKKWLSHTVANWDKDKPVIELFCGSGNFTKILVDSGFNKIIVADVENKNLESLKNEKYKNTTVAAINAYKPSDWKILKKETPHCEYLILDPPRKGFEKLALFASQFKLPKEIVYISCDLERFLNDSQRLKKKGYKLKSAIGVDQFPHTAHIEIMSVFSKN